MVVIFTESIIGFKRVGGYRISSELKKHGVDSRIIDTCRNLDKIINWLDQQSNIPFHVYHKQTT